MMNEETRLYRWQWQFSAEDEVSYEQARSLRPFVRAYLVDGKVEHAETVNPPEEIELVVYYEQVPSDALRRLHQERYGKIPMSVSLPVLQDGEHTTTEIYEYDGDGKMTS